MIDLGFTIDAEDIAETKQFLEQALANRERWSAFDGPPKMSYCFLPLV